jgi:hypothetical protein
VSKPRPNGTESQSKRSAAEGRFALLTWRFPVRRLQAVHPVKCPPKRLRLGCRHASKVWRAWGADSQAPPSISRKPRSAFQAEIPEPLGSASIVGKRRVNAWERECISVSGDAQSSSFAASPSLSAHCLTERQTQFWPSPRESKPRHHDPKGTPTRSGHHTATPSATSTLTATASSTASATLSATSTIAPTLTLTLPHLDAYARRDDDGNPTSTSSPTLTPVPPTQSRRSRTSS